MCNLKVPNIVQYKTEEIILNVDDSITENYETAEEDVKLKNKCSMGIQHIQQSFLMIHILFLIEWYFVFTIRNRFGGVGRVILKQMSEQDKKV